MTRFFFFPDDSIIASQTDRYMYGHPKHVPFNSVNDFYPHLKWLSQRRAGDCACRICAATSKSGGISGKSAAEATTKKTTQAKALAMRARTVMTKGLVDDEGLPDTVPKFLALLKKEGTLERSFEERYSMVSGVRLIA